MKKTVPAESPDAYAAALTGWRRHCVEELRASVRAAATLEEVIKWRNIVYLANGPVLVIRAEGERVLFGFWRGQRLREIEPRLRPGESTRWPPPSCARAIRSTRPPCDASCALP